MKRLNKWLLALLAVLLISSFFHLVRVHAQTESITFQPNMIPQLIVTKRTGRNNESFRFEWLSNTFDIELFFNASGRLYSLKDFEDDFNVAVQYIVDRSESLVRFGWIIDNVEHVMVDSAWFKIEDSSFDYDEIELEEIFSESELGYNITRFHLPDNLVLSFEDLYHKEFVIGWQNKTSTSVKGFSGKSSWNLDPITYSAPTITVIGGSEGSELDFKDIWDADQAGGWNVVHNNNNTNTQFEFDAKIVFGNGTVEGTTWFVDTGKQVSFSASIVTANYERLMDCKAYAHIRFGELVNATLKTTRDGCQFKSLNTYWGYTAFIYSVENIELYSCSYEGGNWRDRLFTSKALKIYNSELDKCYFAYGTGHDIYRTNLHDDEYSIYRASGSYDDVYLWGNTYAIYVYGSETYEFKNLKCRQNTYLVKADTITTDKPLINVDADDWTFYWWPSTAKILRQYTFDLTTDANSTIEITYYGQGGGTIFNETDADGTIPTQTISKEFYNQTGGNTPYSYEPLHLKISKEGYQTYEANVTLSKETSLEIFLQESSGGNGLVFNSVFYMLGCMTFLPLLLIVLWRNKHGSQL